MPATKKLQACGNELEQEEFSTCFIEEEIPGETTSQAAVPEAGDTMDDSEGTGRDADIEQHREAASSEPEEMQQGDTTREGGTVFMPPPISSMQNQWRVPPPFFHPDHLALLFDLRGQMENQVHHGTLMGQRMDMLYDAFSNAPPGWRCPTCAQFFIMPAKEKAQDADATSDATWVTAMALLKIPVLLFTALCMLIVNLCKTIVIAKTLKLHQSWFPTGRIVGILVYFGHGMTLFRFPLRRRNRWHPRNNCNFCQLI
jgi:hypothetical protein